MYIQGVDSWQAHFLSHKRLDLGQWFFHSEILQVVNVAFGPPGFQDQPESEQFCLQVQVFSRGNSECYVGPIDPNMCHSFPNTFSYSASHD